MHFHTQADRGPVSFTGPTTYVGCQRTRSFELVGGKGFEPNGPEGANGVTARQRTIRSYRPSHIDSRPMSLDDTHLSRHLDARLSRIEAKTKQAFQGIALEGLMLDDCRASRARDPPRRSRIDRQVDRSTSPRTPTSGRRLPVR